MTHTLRLKNSALKYSPKKLLYISKLIPKGLLIDINKYLLQFIKKYYIYHKIIQFVKSVLNNIKQLGFNDSYANLKEIYIEKAFSRYAMRYRAKGRASRGSIYYTKLVFIVSTT